MKSPRRRAAVAPDLPIGVVATRTEGAHRTTPDERHEARPIGTSRACWRVVRG